MAKITFKGFSEYRAQLNALQQNTLKILKPAVYDGAAIVADETKRQLRRVIAHPTGALEKSLGLSPMRDDFGYVYTKLGFDGYGDEARKRHPNAPKAYVLEKGRADQPGRKKKPFLSVAIKLSRKKCIEAMDATCNERVKKIMEKASKEAK